MIVLLWQKSRFTSGLLPIDESIVIDYIQEAYTKLKLNNATSKYETFIETLLELTIDEPLIGFL